MWALLLFLLFIVLFSHWLLWFIRQNRKKGRREKNVQTIWIHLFFLNITEHHSSVSILYLFPTFISYGLIYKIVLILSHRLPWLTSKFFYMFLNLTHFYVDGHTKKETFFKYVLPKLMTNRIHSHWSQMKQITVWL